MDEFSLSYFTWHGDERNAAMFALDALLRPAGRGRLGRVRTVDAVVLRLASTCLQQGGRLSAADLAEVQLLASRFRQLRQTSNRPGDDWSTWRLAHDSLTALHMIDTVCRTGPPTG